jgi:hypothetical protein
MTTSIRQAASEIGRTSLFTEKAALIAGAFIAEDYPDQDDAVRVLRAMVELATAQRRSLPAVTIDTLPFLRGEVIAA